MNIDMFTWEERNGDGTRQLETLKRCKPAGQIINRLDDLLSMLGSNPALAAELPPEYYREMLAGFSDMLREKNRIIALYHQSQSRRKAKAKAKA